MKAAWALGCLLMAGSLTLIAAEGGDSGKKFKGDFEAFFKRLDSNMDGKLSKDEFLKMADRAKDKEQAREKLSQAYDLLDPAMTGITREVFRRFLENGKKSQQSQNKAK